MLEVLSIIIGVASLACSIISLSKAKKAKEIANQTKKEVMSFVKGKQKTSLIQELLEAARSIRTLAIHYKNKSIPKNREEEIERCINVLKDNKHIVKNTAIETQIDELSEQINDPKILLEATRFLVENLTAFKFENDFNV